MVDRGFSMRRHCVFAAALVCASWQAVVLTQQTFSSRVVAKGLEAPWEILWGPDDQLWVTERIGKRVIRVNPNTGAVNPAATIEEVYTGAPGSWHEGLLGLAFHPDLLKKV